jgi:hypothetical protein
VTVTDTGDAVSDGAQSAPKPTDEQVPGHEPITDLRRAIEMLTREESQEAPECGGQGTGPAVTPARTGDGPLVSTVGQHVGHKHHRVGEARGPRSGGGGTGVVFTAGCGDDDGPKEQSPGPTAPFVGTGVPLTAPALAGSAGAPGR